jgi:dTMP kinase
VISDRFTDSTVAYQHYGRGLDLEIVEKINGVASQGLVPDLTFLLDIAPNIGLSRKKDGTKDRFQKEDLDFHRRVREGFHNLAMKNSRRWLMLDASASREEIAGLVWDRVSILLGLKKVPDREALSKNIQFISGPPAFPSDQK